jgi:glycosyltransferase involved in cell wall biosynthesis
MTTVSVICPTHDRPAQLRSALESVLAQSHGDLELLVVADGATADTLAVAAELRRRDRRVTVLPVARHGHPAPLRALALTRAHGDTVAYIDDDDSWTPRHLELLLEACDDEHPVAVSGAEYRTQTGTPIRRLRGAALAWHRELATIDGYAEPARVLHRAGVPERVGGWRDLGVGLEDWDLWWRLAEAGVRFRPVDAVTARLTVAGDSRRHSVRCRYFVPLAVMGDEASARAGAVALRAPAARLRAASLGDLASWERDLRADAETIWPADAPAPPGAWTASLAAGLTGAAEACAVRLWGRWQVALPLWCADPRHARALERLLRRRQPRQLQVLYDLAAEIGRPPTRRTT